MTGWTCSLSDVIGPHKAKLIEKFSMLTWWGTLLFMQVTYYC